MTTALRWFITAYYHAWENNTLKIALDTDVPTHLYLRHTNIPMRMHKVSTDFRGSDYMWDPYYCFVQWKEIEQNEPGDTLHHTVDIPNWKEAERQWYMLRGTIDTQETLSISPILTVKAFDPEDAVSLKHTKLTDKEVAGVIDHADKSITADKLDSKIDAAPKYFNTPAVSYSALIPELIFRRAILAPNATWYILYSAAIDPWQLFGTIGYYEPDYQPTNHRLEYYKAQIGVFGTSHRIKNHGPETAYGIEVRIRMIRSVPPW